MSKGEHPENVRARSFLAQQVKHCIGMHQTSKLQLTGIRFAKLGTQTHAEEAPKLRSAARRMAAAEGQATQQPSKAVGLLYLVRQMHVCL